MRLTLIAVAVAGVLMGGPVMAQVPGK